MTKTIENSVFLNEKNLENLKHFRRFHLTEFISGILLALMLIFFGLSGILTPIFSPGKIYQDLFLIIVGLISFFFLVLVIKMVIFEFYLFRIVKKDILNPEIIDISGTPYKVEFKRNFGGRGSEHNMIVETYMWFNINGKKILTISDRITKYKKGCFNKKYRISHIMKRNYELKIFKYSGIIMKGYKK